MKNNIVFAAFALSMVSVFIFIIFLMPKSNARDDLQEFTQYLSDSESRVTSTGLKYSSNFFN